MNSYLSPEQLAAALSLRDLSNPAHGPHAMQQLLDAAVSTLGSGWGIRTATHRPSPIVPVSDNYDRLGFEPDAVTRDRRYSRYLSPTVMLRSHTSASVPWLLTQLKRETDAASDTPHDELWVLPGLVYRRDAIDRRHVAAPHQLDLWRLSDHGSLGERGLDRGDLDEMVAMLVQSLLPGARWRSVPSEHPYTISGRQIDVLLTGGDESLECDWLELAECGLVAPHLLTAAGLDPERWSGLALGLGLDRALMVRKGIPDIRMLRSSEPRIAKQMLDLAPWQPMSLMPEIRRDISIVVDLGMDGETVGDRARQALGERADDLEHVELLALTAHEDLPASVHDRLGTRPGQANALVRLTLRPLDRTLTDAEANAVRDRLYLALHEGERLKLIGS